MSLKIIRAKKELIKLDRSVGALAKKHPKISLSVDHSTSPFESLVRAIAHQQLHAKAAQTILNRMLAEFPKAEFPTPRQLFKMNPSRLRKCGFSKSKVKSIRAIAEGAESGLIPSAKEIKKLSNQQIIDRLTQIYGVGKWTVEMMLIFKLGRLDVWPSDDFGVRRGYQVWKKLAVMPTSKELKTVGVKWGSYSTLMALYLWREADSEKSKKKNLKKVK